MYVQADLKGSVNKIKLKKDKAIFSIYEGIVNSIQSNSKNITVQVKTKNNPQQQLKNTTKLDEMFIDEIIISDDGDGFTEENFESFKTINSIYKINIGGKGVGRLTWLKVFEKIIIESVYKEKSKYYYREISFDLTNGIKELEHKEILDIDKQNISTKIYLKNPYLEWQKYLPKTVDDLGTKVLYHCLGYLIKGTFEITITNGKDSFLCKETYRNELEKNTKKIRFNIESYPFELIHIPIDIKLQPKHEIILTADSREVKKRYTTGDILNSAFEIDNTEKSILAYVESDYLNSNVTEDRTDFLFSKNEDTLFLSENDIIKIVSDKIIEIYDKEITKILDKNKQRINLFLSENPYYQSYYFSNNTILKEINSKSSDENIEDKFETLIKKERKDIKYEIKNIELNGEYTEKFNKIVKKIDQLNQLNLSKYVVHRKIILELFEKILEKKNQDSSYFYEKDLHNLIFPMRSYGNQVDYIQHNLWLIDDKLAFNNFLASDKPFNDFIDDTDNVDRMDIGIFNKALAFSDKDIEDNHSNVTIIEFKRPGRDDVVAGELIEQVFKYIDELKDSKIKTSNGKKIEVSQNSIFNIYVICDLSPKLIRTLNMSGFKKTLDGQGYYIFNENYNSFLQIISLNKVLRDSKLRNKIFFKQLEV